ncbi:MAG: hypothetical protein KJZ78_05735 [Bryobacteraceae bacterium]|nr:hypothetical protein [Bryobacteraceae bacterium]
MVTALVWIAGLIGGVILGVMNKSFEPLLLAAGTGIGFAIFIQQQASRSLTRKYEKRGLDMEKLKIET